MWPSSFVWTHLSIDSKTLIFLFSINPLITLKWFQLLLFNINYFIFTVIWFKACKQFNRLGWYSFDSLLPSVPIGARCLHEADECFYKSTKPFVSLCRSPLENVIDEFVLPLPAMANIFCLSYLDVLWDRR